MRTSLLGIALVLSFFTSFGARLHGEVKTGAEHMQLYLPMLEGKRVAVTVNQTSVVHAPDGSLVPLPDTLLHRGVDIRCIMAPEHGYKGKADAGAHVGNSEDSQTHLPIYSLYGKTKKPQPEWLKDVDVVLFDMQDVGARFYTYLSTLYYVLQACGEQHKEVIILDRPNPNDTIDGPMLDPQQKSFVGIIPIPLLHGCTLGELAMMMLGEGWVFDGNNAPEVKLTAIPCSGWKHGDRYSLPVAPSPNLPNDHAIALYPSLCLFEGTLVSVGRGTAFPFEVYGHPQMTKQPFSFTPQPSASNRHPLQEGKLCHGEDLRSVERPLGFTLSYYIKAHKQLGNTWVTQPSFFDRLAGTSLLRSQINEGKSEAQIRQSWQPALTRYRLIREHYLIYKD